MNASVDGCEKERRKKSCRWETGMDKDEQVAAKTRRQDWRLLNVPGPHPHLGAGVQCAGARGQEGGGGAPLNGATGYG